MTRTLIVSLLADVFVIPPAANGLNKSQKIVFSQLFNNPKKEHLMTAVQISKSIALIKVVSKI